MNKLPPLESRGTSQDRATGLVAGFFFGFFGGGREGGLRLHSKTELNFSFSFFLQHRPCLGYCMYIQCSLARDIWKKNCSKAMLAGKLRWSLTSQDKAEKGSTEMFGRHRQDRRFSWLQPNISRTLDTGRPAYQSDTSALDEDGSRSSQVSRSGLKSAVIRIGTSTTGSDHEKGVRSLLQPVLFFLFILAHFPLEARLITNGGNLGRMSRVIEMRMW